jgi:hypothetical protein
MRGPAGYLVHSCIALDTTVVSVSLQPPFAASTATVRRASNSSLHSSSGQRAENSVPTEVLVRCIALSEDGSMGMEIVLTMAKASVRALVCADDNDEVDVVFELGQTVRDFANYRICYTVEDVGCRMGATGGNIPRIGIGKRRNLQQNENRKLIMSHSIQSVIQIPAPRRSQ